LSKEQNQYFYNIVDYKQQIIYASGNNWDTVLMDVTNISSIGNIMYSTYSIWLLIVSIILLLAMVGVIAITISEKRI
jgi:NADH-ubiquinone oxidoreductase chain 6